MIPRLQNAKLVTDLDFNGFNLKNAGQFLPVPPALLDINDARLSDARQILDGTVTDDSVAPTAGIHQFKLDLDGDIPAGWLGTGEDQAAKGSDAELVANKGAVNGYAGLDASGKVSSSDLPSTGPASGKVTEVFIALPKELDPSIDKITGSGTFGVTWADAPDNSWFGVNGPVGFEPVAGRPSFVTKQLPLNLVPDLSAAKFVSGEFPVEQLPVVAGLGVGHARGILPDPGDWTTEGRPSDYLGRDGKWREIVTEIPYQPRLPDVQLTFLGWSKGLARIQVFCPKAGSTTFFQATNIHALPPLIDPLEETPNPSVLTLAPELTLQAFASKAGWNNSNMATFLVPSPPEETTE